MSRHFAVIMDPIESIKPQKDSTLAMLLQAQSRGWTIHYGQLSDIWLRDGEAYGHLTQLNVADDPAHWFGLYRSAEMTRLRSDKLTHYLEEKWLYQTG